METWRSLLGEQTPDNLKVRAARECTRTYSKKLSADFFLSERWTRTGVAPGATKPSGCPNSSLLPADRTQQSKYSPPTWFSTNPEPTQKESTKLPWQIQTTTMTTTTTTGGLRCKSDCVVLWWCCCISFLVFYSTISKPHVYQSVLNKLKRKVGEERTKKASRIFNYLSGIKQQKIDFRCVSSVHNCNRKFTATHTTHSRHSSPHGTKTSMCLVFRITDSAIAWVNTTFCSVLSVLSLISKIYSTKVCS